MNSDLNITADVSESVNALLKEPSKSVGGVGATIVDFLHNTLFYHMQKYNIKAKNNLEDYKRQLEEKMKRIPEECVVEPNMNIWGQAIDSLRWNLDDSQSYIRDMFANLLANDVDKRTKKKVLPSYIDIVKQLSEQDALFLKDLREKNRGNSLSTIELRWIKPNGEYLRIPNERLILLADCGETMSPPTEILDNLERLKIINLRSGEYLTKDRIKCEAIFEKRKNKYPVPIGFDRVAFEQGKLDITEFGRGFLEICLRAV